MATDLVQKKMNGAIYTQARKARGLEQTDVAKRIGASQSKVSAVERGEGEYTTAEKQAFADLIGVPLVALLDWLGYSVGPQPLTWLEWYAQALADQRQREASIDLSKARPWGKKGQQIRTNLHQEADDDTLAGSYPILPRAGDLAQSSHLLALSNRR